MMAPGSWPARWSDPFGRRRQTEEVDIVVVLQGDQAFWFQWQSKALSRSFVEPLQADVLRDQVHCPWVGQIPGDPDPCITLVLDTSLDEIDRVRIEAASRGWIRRLQLHQLQRQLQKDYPLASLHRLPAQLAPDVLSIVHTIIPQDWKDWLVRLQNQSVCISHVVTAQELLCCCAKASLTSNKGSTLDASRLLFDVSMGRERRHLLVEEGIPVFMRIIEADGSPSSGQDRSPTQDGPALLESLQHMSLQHIQRHLHPDEAYPHLVTPCLPGASPSEEFAAARVLAALCMNCPVELVVRTVDSDGNLTSPSDAALVVADCRPQRSWRVSRARRVAREALQLSRVKLQGQRRIRLLQNATLVSALLAMVTLVLAMVHGFGSARERAVLAAEKELLSEQIGQLTQTVLTLASEPDAASRSLETIASHVAVEPLRPEVLLQTVAATITRYPALVLDRLSWTALLDDAPVDMVFNSLDQVAHRDRIWSSSTPPSYIQMELAGSVSGEWGLRERQQILDAFVEDLSSLPLINRVTVLESPVDSARSSDALDSRDSGYRLSLLMASS